MALAITAVEMLRGEREPDARAGAADDRLELTFGAAPTAQEALDAGRIRLVETRGGAPSGDVGVASQDRHVVRKGETLSSIANDRLGDARLAGELARLNGIDDPKKLQVGQVLRLR